MVDVIGPANAPNAVTSRPSDSRSFGATNTWFKDCTDAATDDGTMIQAAWLNGIMAQFRDAFVASAITLDNADDMLTRAIRALAPGAPTGSMIFWPASTAPTGWLKRNGAAISRSTYSALFAIIGTTYGTGDGSTTFNLPDDRGLFLRGLDEGKGYDTGRTLGSEQTDLLREHYHNPASGMSNFLVTVTGAPIPDLPDYVGAGPYDYSFAALTGGVAGGLGGTETRPRNRAYLPIIKY